MSFFKAKSDLQFMREFREDVIKLWELEKNAYETIAHHSSFSYSPSEFQQLIQQKATEMYPEYQEIRSRIATCFLQAKSAENCKKKYIGLLAQ
ncbi:hypothetical protein AVP43_02732 [Geobacillus stearothermophilus]|uniref:hypothetical protein n=1 Tax=Geobacillus sp. DSP4a TaxID=2508873 RepID=UPI00067BE6F2|nr:hypothetical protein [Geobacillus sp. DSP4a]AKU26975.1 hypothetical protein IB49_11660 [Geobacillus sp. LC300]KZE94227.1 hypothetical protein AVP43_02732 [Geobacillus stearothermophilus]NNV00876.1 hypothetical protein [Geobacillus sp. DSP4a]